MMQLIIVSGRSGSGKSTALGVLEDNGFYCIDNLPAGLLIELLEHASHYLGDQHQQVAVSIDARNRPDQLEQFAQLLKQIRTQPAVSCAVLYLDADDPSLLKRFSETRRRHPLSSEHCPLAQAIYEEHALLKPIADLADLRIDTSKLNLHQLRDMLRLRLLNRSDSGTAILLQSFGFKRGLPIEADLIFDVRCLPNPYWHPELRELTGLDRPVMDYLSQQPDVEELFQDTLTYLEKWLPRFAIGNRAYVTVGIGCTGGQHRSVYLAERLGRALKKKLSNIQIHHRELS